MKKIIILACFAFLVGCKNYESKVVCDDFETPWSWSAYSDGGVVYWRLNEDDYRASRKMKQGETCHHKRRVKE